jgi:serine/threonine-protein kinase
VVKDLDPVVEKVILRCLEADPASRPPNALAVAAALPGGDPLAAALAAGETPSPQLVAASGETTGLVPRSAIAILATILLGLGIGTYLTIRYSALEKMHLEQPPEVLAQKARETVTRLGYPEKPADTAFGFSYDTNFRDSVENDAKKTLPNWDEISLGRPTLLNFWYRQSPDQMAASDFRDILMVPGIITDEDPATTLSGMINVKLDARGRLIYFQAIPPQKDSSAPGSSAPDWAPLFAAAELDPSSLQAASPQWTSLGTSDSRAAWTGAWPGSTRPLRVEAAAWHGKPVFFAMIGDWNKPWRMITPRSVDQEKNRLANILGLILLISGLVAAVLVGRRNYRQGRGDREGAWRLAQIMFVLEILLWLCRSHMVPGFETFGLMMLAIAAALLIGGVVWMLYMATEPWIRRRWPHAIISWSRLISGQVRDPLVGRDILIGVALGVVWILIFEVAYIPLGRLGAAPQFNAYEYLLGGRRALGEWLTQVPTSIIATLQFFFLALGLKLLLRKDWIAATAFVAIYVGIKSLQTTHPSVEIPVVALIYLVLTIIIFRFGLLPLAVGAFTVDMFANVPMTADFSAWYMGTTVMALLSVVALAAWGFYHSLGGQPLWKVETE